jgi:phospholipase D
MKSVFPLIALIATVTIAIDASALRFYETDTAVAFQENCEDLLLYAVGKAKKEIIVAAYAFTRHQIADALIEANENGIEVKVKMDREQGENEYGSPTVDKLEDNDIDIQLIEMPRYRHMHNKFIIVDERYVLTGSYNFPNAATKDNYENVVLIDDEDVAKLFVLEWERIKDKKAKKKKKKK